MHLNRGLKGEHTVKQLRLSKALTVRETTTIYEICRRMTTRRTDAVLLTDSDELLSGILTNKVCLKSSDTFYYQINIIQNRDCSSLG